MGDFNMTSENGHQKDFTNSSDFENLLKEPTCFKSTSPTTIDVFLTNRKDWFMKSSTNKTEISGHQKLIYRFLKSTYAKGKPTFVYYRNLKTLTKRFLIKIFLKISKTLVIHLKCFMTLSRTILIVMPLWRRKFMTKKLREEVMTSPVCAIKELNNNRKYENWSYENWSNY